MPYDGNTIYVLTEFSKKYLTNRGWLNWTCVSCEKPLEAGDLIHKIRVSRNPNREIFHEVCWQKLKGNSETERKPKQPIQRKAPKLDHVKQPKQLPTPKRLPRTLKLLPKKRDTTVNEYWCGPCKKMVHAKFSKIDRGVSVEMLLYCPDCGGDIFIFNHTKNVGDSVKTSNSDADVEREKRESGDFMEYKPRESSYMKDPN